ncbi:hypothetical protein [Streptomyces sp. V3I8]|uniref:hypothetical protein n=1 Tax=Streptomyces sp. V3I8 TaxID=3042279 RepID=UPI0027D7FEFD|nr:hypothetical protein [Streptomyces sp. V3I8]
MYLPVYQASVDLQEITAADEVDEVDEVDEARTALTGLAQADQTMLEVGVSPCVGVGAAQFWFWACGKS